MNEKEICEWCIIIVIGIIILLLGLSGCLDITGYEECKESYDNLILMDGWKVIGHSSDFVCCVEYRYFVTFHITNWTDSEYVYGFVYDSKDDELIYSPDGLTPKLSDKVIEWN